MSPEIAHPATAAPAVGLAGGKKFYWALGALVAVGVVLAVVLGLAGAYDSLFAEEGWTLSQEGAIGSLMISVGVLTLAVVATLWMVRALQVSARKAAKSVATQKELDKRRKQMEHWFPTVEELQRREQDASAKLAELEKDREALIKLQHDLGATAARVHAMESGLGHRVGQTGKELQSSRQDVNRLAQQLAEQQQRSEAARRELDALREEAARMRDDLANTTEDLAQRQDELARAGAAGYVQEVMRRIIDSNRRYLILAPILILGLVGALVLGFMGLSGPGLFSVQTAFLVATVAVAVLAGILFVLILALGGAIRIVREHADVVGRLPVSAAPRPQDGAGVRAGEPAAAAPSVQHITPEGPVVAFRDATAASTEA